MRWRAGMVGAALLPMVMVQAPGHAADAGVPVAAEPRVEFGQARLVRVDARRRYVVQTYSRCRIVWHVDASSANPAYRLC